MRMLRKSEIRRGILDEDVSDGTGDARFGNYAIGDNGEGAASLRTLPIRDIVLVHHISGCDGLNSIVSESCQVGIIFHNEDSVGRLSKRGVAVSAYKFDVEHIAAARCGG